jgi:glucuronate isomerase
MSDQLRSRLFAELDSIRLIDPHTHIDPHAAASKTLADILGYHYYTELIHAAGMPRDEIEEPGLDPKEKVRRLVERIEPLRNTAPYEWLLEVAREYFDFPHGEHLTLDNWELLYDTAAAKLAHPDWEEHVLRRTKLEAVFLTNQFDDPLTGFDTSKYIPCLRTDDLVFHLGNVEVRQRLERATNTDVHDAASLRSAIGKLFEHFTANGARACAISLPPDFSPEGVPFGRLRSQFQHLAVFVDPVLSVVLKGLEANDSDEQRRFDDYSRQVSHFVFWTLAEFCSDFGLPFDLMIGVNRNVYGGGVYQGRDLFDSRVSLMQYKELFNAFPQVTFPVSVLASVTNQELMAYAWIFPNVVANGHWWYSNTPAFIERDASARLEAVPQTKLIGYYSDAYKLEFALPKFAMYKRILAKILAERFVIERGWSEQQALELGRTVLRGNVERIFGMG